MSLVNTIISVDPYVFDLKKAVEKVEEFGDMLQHLVWLTPGLDFNNNPIMVPGRSDMCECERLTKCPNGTTSSEGSSSWLDCNSQNVEVLRRINLVPSWYNNSG